jgi:DNA-binding transcriptional LysR family regulator
MSGFRAARNENEGTGAIDAAVRFGPSRPWPARQLLVEGDTPFTSALARLTYCIWLLRFPSSTETPGQTRATRSSLVTTSPARSTRAMAAAVEGHGITRLFSYHVADYVKKDELKIVLAGDEPPPIPVHVVSPNDRLSVPRVRAYIDFAIPRLRKQFTLLAKSMSTPGEGNC